MQLDGPSVADVWLETGRAATRAHHSSLVVQQSAIASEIQALGGQVLATYQRVYNGLAIHIGPEQVDAVRALPGVVSVSPVPLYQTMLDETVSWIGAQDIQNAGFDGTGIRVAVIDSGIDYTHEHLGGSGLQADTNKALAQASQAADPALYPSAKVVGGYDFVGSQWTGTTVTTLSPDPNPMDDQAGGINGHGTHVASIIAGVKTAKLGQGVAPGAQLYALKVCSSVSTSCSGVAIQQALDWSSDPNGDLFFDDRVDVVN
ncbi:MAG TPA: S8 family serine peptidase, partial [Caldilineaceae bacterium]|nr:S8 family serine peptidase [Caldilineaceae bacterium]